MNPRLPGALFFMRLTVFLVMLMWTLDKFVRPEHASLVYENFYMMPGFGSAVSFIIGAIELVIIVAFVLGFKKLWTYGFVLVFHALSTLSSWHIYTDPYAPGPNLLFFAAWPMLAACWMLFVLRDDDTIFSFGD